MAIHDLCGSFCSVLSLPRIASLPQMTDAGIHVYQCDTANLTQLFNDVRGWTGEPLSPGSVAGAGAEPCEEDAKFKAVCEAAERYSSSVLLPSECRVSTYSDLDVRALDWRTLPRLGKHELDDPLQPFRLFHPDDPIRWVWGLDLMTGKRTMIPSALSHLFPRLWSTERFSVPISTGTAVHTSELSGITSAMNEVVERDATALTWLLRRPLKSIALDTESLCALPPVVAQLIESAEVKLYNATTDIGIPTVYARRFRPENSKAANVVACSSAFDFLSAIGKSVKESIMVSRTLEQGNFKPVDDPLDCESVYDGAAYMARASQAAAFQFLEGNGIVSLRDLQRLEPAGVHGEPGLGLRWLLLRLKALAMDAYVVNITSDELYDVGLKCYRAIVPQLMPMSLVTRGRFLATPRLSQINEMEGLRRNIPIDINPNPQPFA